MKTGRKKRADKKLPAIARPSDPTQPPAPSLALISMVFLGFILFFFRKGLLNPSEIIAGTDTNLFFPFKYYWCESLKAGHPAFWNPYLNLGFPFTAHPNVGAFSPSNLLFFLFNYPFAFTLQYILHFWLCCLGTYLFLRRLGCNWEGSFLGALAFSFSSFFVSRIFWGQHAMLWVGAWIPWMFYFFHRALEEGKIILTAMASACSALALFEGYTQIAVYALLGMLIYLFYRTLNHTLSWGPAMRTGALFLFFFAGLAACQIFPTLEAMPFTNRAHWGLGDVMCEYLEPSDFFCFLRPDFKGCQVGDPPWSGRWGYFEEVNYVGLLPFLIFLAGLAWFRRIRFYPFFVFLAFFFSVLSLGNSTAFSAAIFKFFYDWVPIFGKNRSIGRMMALTSFALACGAGLVLSAAASHWRKRGAAAARWAGRVTLVILALTMVDLYQFGNRFIFLYYPDFYTSMEQIFPDAAVVKPLLADPTHPRFIPRDVLTKNLFHSLSQVYNNDMFILQQTAILRGLRIEDTPLADLLRVRYCYIASPSSPSDRMVRIAPEHYLNQRALPRAMMVGGCQVSTETLEGELRTLESGKLDLRSVLLVKKNPDIQFNPVPGVAGEAEIVSYENNEVVMNCRADRPCFLFLSDPYFPHWEAFVDGNKTQIYDADGGFRAVPIEKEGLHQVVMRYRPTPLYLGLSVSALTWLLLGTMAWKSRRFLVLPSAQNKKRGAAPRSPFGPSFRGFLEKTGIRKHASLR